MYISFSNLTLRSRGFNREASTLKPVAFLKSDVAKLGQKLRESKKRASTTNFTKQLINSVLQKHHLYNEKNEDK